MTVVVKGYREFNRALRHADKDLRREIREAFREVADDVRDEGRERFSRYGATSSHRRSHAYSASRYRTIVRQTGVNVEQTLRKSNRKHPEYGIAQMKHGLLPAMLANRGNLSRRAEAALQKVIHLIEARSR